MWGDRRIRSRQLFDFLALALRRLSLCPAAAISPAREFDFVLGASMLIK